MTEKISPMAAPRCALDVWKYVHRGNAHKINQPINHPTFGGRYAEGTGPPITLARISTPFPASSISPTAPTLHRSRASLPPSHPFRPLLPRCSRSLLYLSPTTTASACIVANLPRPRVFRDSFRPESIPPPRRVETVGATAAGIQRVQPSVLGLSLVSLVTAPHKGIAL